MLSLSIVAASPMNSSGGVLRRHGGHQPSRAWACVRRMSQELPTDTVCLARTSILCGSHCCHTYTPYGGDLGDLLGPPTKQLQGSGSLPGWLKQQQLDCWDLFTKPRKLALRSSSTAATAREHPQKSSTSSLRGSMSVATQLRWPDTQVEGYLTVAAVAQCPGAKRSMLLNSAARA